MVISINTTTKSNLSFFSWFHEGLSSIVESDNLGSDSLCLGLGHEVTGPASEPRLFPTSEARALTPSKQVTVETQ